MTNMELIKLMSHLIVTVLLIVGYVLLIFLKGAPDPTLQGVLMVAVGYWFGAVTLNKGGNGNDTKQ